MYTRVHTDMPAQAAGGDDVDYLVGRVLPFMHQTPGSYERAICEFTVSEAERLRLTGLPVMLNHNDGTRNDKTGDERPLICVGRVEGMAVRGVDARVLLALTPDASGEATYASNAVAKGRYMGISLGHGATYEASASTGHNTLIKTPIEVSVCEKGRRMGSNIEHFMPSRSTIVRLYDQSPDTAHQVASRFGYAAHLPDPGRATRQEYIEAFAAASANRLASVCAAERLTAQTHLSQQPVRVRASATEPPHTMATTADAQQQQQQPQTVAAAVDQQQQSQAQAPPPRQQQSAGAAAAVDGSRSMEAELPNGPDLTDPKAAAAWAVQREREHVDLMKRLAQAEQAAKELETLKQAKRDEQKAKFMEIIESFKQHAKKVNAPDSETADLIEIAQAAFAQDPEQGLKHIGSACQIAVRASQSMHNAEQMQAQQMAKQVAADNNAFLTQKAREMAMLREQGRNYTALSSSQSQFVLANQPPPQQQPPVSSFERRFSEQQSFFQPTPAPAQTAIVPAQQQQYMDTSADDFVADELPQPLFVRASETEAVRNDYDAAAQYELIHRLTGRRPTLKEVQYGAKLVPTGKMEASATGEQVPGMRVDRLRRTPAYIAPDNFAKEFDAQLQRAMQQHPDKGVRRMMPLSKTQHL